MKTDKVLLQPAECALDMGDGSERGLYVNQDYILQKMRKVHRGISLMYTYYPKDKTWPLRASVACPQPAPGITRMKIIFHTVAVVKVCAMMNRLSL